MRAQNNPVLFVLLGRCATLAPALAQMLADYRMDGVETLCVGPQADGGYDSDCYDSDWMKREVNRVQQRFIRKTYTGSGLIRVNYVLDDAVTDLPTVREWAEQYLSLLYPDGILTDVFWLLDDASALDGHTPQRVRLMQMLSGGGVPDARIYLLSNLDMQNAFTAEDDLLRTIALLSLFKDYEPTEYAAGPDASRYNEFFFTENSSEGSAASGQRFLTAGSASLQVPAKALQALLMTLLLDFGKNQAPASPGTEDAPPARKAAADRGGKGTSWLQNYVWGLAIPAVNPKSDYADLSRQALIDWLFGQRLDEAVAMHRQDTPAMTEADELLPDDPYAQLAQMPFYSALTATGAQGKYIQAIRQALAQNRQQLEAAEDNLQSWLAGTPSLRGQKRRLSPWRHTPAWPYHLASEYMSRRFRIQALLNRDESLQQALARMADYHQPLSGYLSVIDAALERYAKEAQSLLAEAFAPFVQNPVGYFRNAFEDYARENQAPLLAITAPLTGHLQENNFETYLARLERFIAEQILPSPAFNRHFMDMLNTLALEEQPNAVLPNLIADWLQRRQRFNLRLKTGYANLYTETNVLMPRQNAEQAKSAYEARGLGRMNVFVDDAAGRIDVLYHAGTFTLEDLYYRDLYI